MSGKRYIIRYQFEMLSTGLLRIGDEDDSIQFDALSGMPIIPATSLSGAVHAYLYHNDDSKSLEMLFGSIRDNGRKSKVFFGDSIANRWDEKLGLEERRHVAINRRRGAAERGAFYSLTALPAGIGFPISIEIHADNQEEKEQFSSLIEDAVSGVHKGSIRLGAKKTNGNGSFEVREVKRDIYDLHDRKELKAYLLNEECNREEITGEIIGRKQQDHMFEVFCKDVKTDTPVLVGGIDENAVGEDDRQSVQNKNGEYIIPGSSLKGVLRSQCERIAEFLSLDDRIIHEMFGTAEGDGRCGSVYVDDAVLRGVNDKVSYHNVTIDRFTGGALTGRKFSNRPVMGTGDLKVHMQLDTDDERRNVKKGIILLAIRDIAKGIRPVGGYSKTGYGRLKAAGFKVMDEGNEYEIILDRPNEKIESYVQAAVDFGKTHGEETKDD